MDAERPIEKLLRAFGRKRRADAGPPLELHSADRARLQREVAGALAAKEARLAPVPRWWPRLVWAMGLAVLLAGASRILWPVHPSPQGSLAMNKEKTDNGGALEKRMEADTPANRPVSELKSVPALTPPPASAPVVAAAPASRKPAKVPAPTAIPASPTASMPVASPPAPARRAIAGAKDEAVTATPPGSGYDSRTAFADSTVKSEPAGRAGTVEVNGAARPAATTEKMATAETYKQLSKTPSEGYAVNVTMTNSMSLAATRAAGDMQRYARVGDREQAMALRDKSSSADAVLAIFTVQRNGRQLKIIDQDGSVYTGRVETNAVANGDKQKKADGRQGRQDFDFAGSAFIPPGQVFRVAGTNRTLKKLVEFSGTIRTVTNGVAQAPGAVGGPATFGGQLNRAGGLVRTNFSISGRAVIGGKTQVPIEAGGVP